MYSTITAISLISVTVSLVFTLGFYVGKIYTRNIDAKNKELAEIQEVSDRVDHIISKMVVHQESWKKRDAENELHAVQYLLEKAIEEEDYEEAARLRDLLKNNNLNEL